jgi:mannose-1-phosphate guanylyltransferase
MRALLLSAGLGTRLRPLTETTPKCLVPVKGQPLLGIWLRQLSNAGIGPFLINTHYLAAQVKAYIDGSAFGESVTLVHESELLGTAGTLLANLEFFDCQDGFLIHADNYSRADLTKFVEAHHERPHGCVMTMMTFRSDNPSSCGIVELDGRGVVIGFHEKVKSPPGNLANAAVYIISTEMMEILRADFQRVSDFSTEVLPYFQGRIFTYQTPEAFYDVGTPENYAAANAS